VFSRARMALVDCDTTACGPAVPRVPLAQKRMEQGWLPWGRVGSRD
jgi:hypothetical protein